VSDEPEFDEIVPDEWPTFYTPVPVWVLLSGCTAQAYRMYAFLAEHINNRIPGQRIAFPSQKAIAKAMVLKDYRDVAKYRDELDALGAIRYEEFRYAGGMRRRYRYWVRFNPPAEYAGLLSLAAFYEAHPEVKAKRSQSAKDAALEETPGQLGGGKKPTSEGGENPTSQGGESPTAQQPDPVEPDPVERDGTPSARSASDARSASTSGSKGSSSSGSAASGKKKPAPLTHSQRQQVQAVRSLLPADLNSALPGRTPRNLSDAILDGLAAGQPRERTVEQLVAFRVMRRWDGYWAAKFYAGDLDDEKGRRRTVGPLLSMLKYQPKCGSDRCDDRTDVDTAEACRSCEMRHVDKRADRYASEAEKPMSEASPTVLPAPRTAAEPTSRPRCPECHRPLTNSTADAMCRDCREDAIA
jgi:hypothetical protein